MTPADRLYRWVMTCSIAGGLAALLYSQAMQWDRLPGVGFTVLGYVAGTVIGIAFYTVHHRIRVHRGR